MQQSETTNNLTSLHNKTINQINVYLFDQRYILGLTYNDPLVSNFLFSLSFSSTANNHQNERTPCGVLKYCKSN